MKLKLLKLSQVLEDLNNPEEAQEIKNFIDQQEPEEQEEIIYPHDKESKIFKDYERSTPAEDYPSEQENLDVVSQKYYRDLAIQAYLDLFYGGARLLNELGSGGFSDTFLAKKDGKSIAIKFSESPKEYISYLEIKNKRSSLPDELKKILPIVYEAREIKDSEISKVNKKVKSTEGNFYNPVDSIKYKSFIATELLTPTDMKIQDLMYEPDFINVLVKNEKSLLPKIKALLNKWILNWNLDSNNLNLNMDILSYIKNILNDKNNLNVIATDILLGILNLKNSEKDLWLDDNMSETDNLFGGSFISEVINIFKNEMKKNLLSLTQMRLPPRKSTNIEQINSELDKIIVEPDISIRKEFVKIILFYSNTFPKYPNKKVKNIKMKSFLDKLNELKTYGIRWGDVHGDNLMIRLTSTSHGYGDLVVADVGMFKFLA